MATGYTIFTYGNVDTLATLFNGMAAMVGHDSYLAAIALVLILGFFGALLSMAFLKHLHGVHWLLAVAIINGVLLVPKSTVQIVDKLSGQAPVLVDNVPWGVASLASVVSSTGSALTELFETAFQALPAALGTKATATLPADLTYETTGMMFGSTLIQQSAKTRFSDPTYEADLVNFVANCTFYDLSQGLIDNKEFVNSKNVWTLMSTTNVARFSTYHDPATGLIDSLPCPDVYGNLNAGMAAQLTQELTNLAHLVSPSLKARRGESVSAADVASAVSTVDGQLKAGYIRAMLGDTATSSAEIIRQNALINAVRGAGALFSQRTNDPSAMILGMSQAQTAAAMNAQKIVSGEMAKSALPMLQNGITYIVYGSYPLVILMALVLGGMGAVQLLKKYALALAWLAMWPPLYAMVNYIHSTEAAKEVASAAFANGVQGMTLVTAPAVYSTTVSYLATTSWMLVSVPLIASAIVFGMDKLSNLGMGFMTSMGSSASFGSRGAGDYTGNMSLNQLQLAPNRSDAFMEKFTNVLGTSERSILTGDSRYTANLGKAAAGLMTSAEMSRGFSTQSANAERYASQQTELAQQASSATLAKILEKTRTRSTGSQFVEDWRHGNNASLGKKIDSMSKITDQLKRDLNLKDTETATEVLRLSLGAGVGAGGGKKDGGKATEAIMKLLPVTAGLDYQGQQQSQNAVESAVGRARAMAIEAGITDTKALTDEFVKSEAFQKSTKVDNAWREGVNASYQKVRTHTKNASEARESANEYRQQADEVKRLAASGKVDWTPEYNNFLERYAVRNELAPAQYRINNPNEATGEKAIYWQNIFFEQAQIGRTLNGGIALLMPDGSAPPNKHPLQPNTHSGTALDDKFKHSGVRLDGQLVTPESIQDTDRKNRQQVPKYTGGDPEKMGQPTRAAVEGAPTKVKSAMTAAEIKEAAAQTELLYQFSKKAGDISLASEWLGDSTAAEEAKAEAKKPLGGVRK